MKRIISQSSAGWTGGAAPTPRKKLPAEYHARKARRRRMEAGIQEPAPFDVMFQKKMTKKQKLIGEETRLVPPKTATMAEWKEFDARVKAHEESKKKS